MISKICICVILSTQAFHWKISSRTWRSCRWWFAYCRRAPRMLRWAKDWWLHWATCCIRPWNEPCFQKIRWRRQACNIGCQSSQCCCGIMPKQVKYQLGWKVVRNEKDHFSKRMYSVLGQELCTIIQIPMLETPPIPNQACFLWLAKGLARHCCEV